MLDKISKNNKILRFCKKCFTPDSRPRIQFDTENVCNACRFYENRNKKINFVLLYPQEKRLSLVFYPQIL